MADHNSKINALPRFDPNNLGKGYSYDYKSYSREDYARYKALRIAADKARQAAAERALAKTVRQAWRDVRDIVRPNRPLEWDNVSTCFADLQYDAARGGVVATFHRGGDVVYFYEMSRAEAREWFDEASAGGFFNGNVR